MGNEYSRNILNFIFLFLDDHVFFTKFIIILYAPRCTYIYQLFYKLFFKLNYKLIFYEKQAHVGDECPWKLIKIIYNYEI